MACQMATIRSMFLESVSEVSSRENFEGYVHVVEPEDGVEC